MPIGFARRLSGLWGYAGDTNGAACHSVFDAKPAGRGANATLRPASTARYFWGNLPRNSFGRDQADPLGDLVGALPDRKLWPVKVLADLLATATDADLSATAERD
jgi:hypothetical protein